MASRRILITGLSTYWGGRLAQALEHDARGRGDHRRRPPPAEGRARAHRVRRRSPTTTRSSAASSRRRDRHGRRHAPRRRLDRHDAAPGPREQRHRDDERPRRVQRAGLAGAQGRLPLAAALLRRRAGRPGLLHRGHAPAAPGRAPRSSATSSRPSAPSRDFAATHPDTTVTVLRFANGLGPALRTSYTRLLGLPAVPMILGFDPRYAVRPRGRHRRRARARGAPRPPGHLQRAPADGVLALSEVARRCSASRSRRSCRRGGPAWRWPSLRRAGRARIAPEMLNQLRFGRGVDNRRLKATGYRFRYTTRETVLKLARAPAPGAAPARPVGASYRYEREVEEFLRWSPSVRRQPTTRGSRPPTPAARRAGRVIAALEGEGGQVNVAPGGEQHRRACR